MLRTLDADLELKAVDAGQRLIEGYAAAFGNLDRHGDILEPGAFADSLKANPDVLVFYAHRVDSFPIGEPVVVREDKQGLYTQTKVYESPDGDALLALAARRMGQGKRLGMSIGYRTNDASFEVADGEMVRRLKSVDLVEYSFLASPALAANDQAGVTAMKDAVHEALDEVFGSKAEWSTAYVNALPDSAFAAIEPGGSKDDQGKTTPRSLRHYPHHDAAGKLDLPHLNAARSRVADPNNYQGGKAHLAAHAASSESAAGDLEDLGAALEVLTAALDELKAGRTMNQGNLDQLHGAMKQLGTIHSAVCDMADCPHAAKSERSSERAELEARLAAIHL